MQEFKKGTGLLSAVPSVRKQKSIAFSMLSPPKTALGLVCVDALLLKKQKSVIFLWGDLQMCIFFCNFAG